MKRAVITVSFGKREDVGKNEGDIIGTPFSAQLERWRESFKVFTQTTNDNVYRREPADLIVWEQLPPGCPPHREKPYAFKAYALLAAWRAGYEQVVWADTSVYYNRANPADLWHQLSSANDGVFIARNPWNCGQWTCDTALEPLGITREEAFGIPQIIATAFALDFRYPSVGELLNRLLKTAEHPSIFPGPWTNYLGQASSDSRVLGHRHDQTAMSVIVANMRFTTWPQQVWASYFQTKYGR